MRSHTIETHNEQPKQTQQSGQIKERAQKLEHQTYLLQRQRELKQEEHLLIKQEYLEKYMPKPDADPHSLSTGPENFKKIESLDIDITVRRTTSVS